MRFAPPVVNLIIAPSKCPQVNYAAAHTTDFPFWSQRSALTGCVAGRRSALHLVLAMRQACLFRVIVLSIVTAALVRTAIGLQGQEAMKPTEQTAFDVIGIEARTNNEQEAQGNGAIRRQWQRLFKEN